MPEYKYIFLSEDQRADLLLSRLQQFEGELFQHQLNVETFLAQGLTEGEQIDAERRAMDELRVAIEVNAKALKETKKHG